MSSSLTRFIGTAALLAASLAPQLSSAAPGDCLVFLGPYTGAKTGSKGIYVSRFNSNTGELKPAELAVETGSPSFLAIHPSKKYLYCVGELAIPGQKGGGVSAFSLDKASGKLSLINQVSSVGAGPCHIRLNNEGSMAIVANYGGGSCSSFAIKADGSLSGAVSVMQHTGSSVDPKRQKEPHTHSATYSPDGRFAFFCDLGLDKVMVYQVDAAKAVLTPNDPAFATVPPGSGPRHFAFHPSGKFAFANGEMLMNLNAFRYDADKGALSLVETVSTLPAGEAMSPKYSTAEVVCHPNGKFVYVSNRGHNTIACYTFDEAKAKLTLTANVPSGGLIPRNFNIDPSGKWLITAHNSSKDIVVFAIDPTTGSLKPNGQRAEVNSVVCVKFLELE